MFMPNMTIERSAGIYSVKQENTSILRTKTIDEHCPMFAITISTNGFQEMGFRWYLLVLFGQ